jgi:serine/threonine-protein kinase
VLIFSDPKRPLQRYTDADKKLCDCALFCTSELGEAAVEAFNEWGAHEQTRDVPAILMVDNRQTEIIKAARLSEHRMLLSLPFKLRELRVALLKLLRPGYQPVMK